jgi:lipoprotein-releasing system permease protein
VVRAIAFTEGQAMASSARSSTGVLVRGMRLEDLKKLTSVNNEKLRGSLDTFDEANGVAIGYRLAWKHGLNIGDQITLVSPEGPATIFGTAPRFGRFRSYRDVRNWHVGV